MQGRYCGWVAAAPLLKAEEISFSDPPHLQKKVVGSSATVSQTPAATVSAPTVARSPPLPPRLLILGSYVKYPPRSRLESRSLVLRSARSLSFRDDDGKNAGVCETSRRPPRAPL